MITKMLLCKTCSKLQKMNTLFVLPLAIMGWEWLAIALVVLLLFGGKKIPELMKGVGQGISNFKKGMKEDSDDINQ